MFESADKAPGFRRIELSPESAERLVLRFPKADASVTPGDGDLIRCEFELRGPAAAIENWQPSIRHVEGIIVVAEGDGDVGATELRIRVPAALHDVEIHTRDGSIESVGFTQGIQAETDSGSIRIQGASSAEARSAVGNIEISACGSADIKVGTGAASVFGASGKVLVSSNSGDIVAEDCVGDLIVDTKSGEVAVLRPRGRVMVQSQAGDVELESSGNFGGGDIATSTGHIGLTLAGANLELRAETLSGKLHTPSGEIQNFAGPRRCAITVGVGGRRIHAKSVSGDIDIEF